MAIDIESIQAAYANIQPALSRLNTLLRNGAVKTDVDAQKQVVDDLVLQFHQVLGTAPMPVDPSAPGVALAGPAPVSPGSVETDVPPVKPAE